MPDGEFLPPFDFNCVEQHMSQAIHAKVQGPLGRAGTLGAPLQAEADPSAAGAAAACQARNLCMRGCPFGGILQLELIDAALGPRKTGNLTLRPHSVVHSIVYDDKTGKASGRTRHRCQHAPRGAGVHRAHHLRERFQRSTPRWCCSTPRRRAFPHGLGNDSGLLGKYVMHHNYRVEGHGRIDGFTDEYFFGRNPTECILVNFRNLGKQDTDFVGGLYHVHRRLSRAQHADR